MKTQDVDMFYGLTIVIIFICASLFTLFANILIYSFDEVKNNVQKYTGISSFGGIIGLFVSLLIFTKSKYKIADLKNIINPVIITGLLVMGIGRFGCFSSGCCYGESCNTYFAVIYHRAYYAPVGISLIPIQLYESIFLLTSSILGLVLYLKKGKSVWLQLIFIYLIFRFFAEFFRGEPIHQVKIFCHLDIYQIIILIVISVGLISRNKHLKVIIFRNRKENTHNT